MYIPNQTYMQQTSQTLCTIYICLCYFNAHTQKHNSHPTQSPQIYKKGSPIVKMLLYKVIYIYKSKMQILLLYTHIHTHKIETYSSLYTS